VNCDDQLGIVNRDDDTNAFPANLADVAGTVFGVHIDLLRMRDHRHGIVEHNAEATGLVLGMA
jgi:hypothetical protein